MRQLIFTLILSIIGANIHAAEEEGEKLVHLAVFPSYEVNPTLSFALVVPQNLSAEPEDGYSINVNTGNSFNPNTKVESKVVEGCSFEYDVDTVIDRLDFRLTKKITNNLGVETTVGVFTPSGTSRLGSLGTFVNDAFIEAFHLMAGKNDPFGRGELGYDRSIVRIKDCEGNEIELKPGDVYYMPLRIGATYYRDLIKTAKHRVSFNIGAHIAFPLSEASRSVSGAVSVNLMNTYAVTENVDWTVAAGGFAARQNLHTVNHDTPLVIENDWYNDQYVTTGFTFEKRSGIKYRMGVSLHNKSRFMKSDNYDWDKVDQRARRAIGAPNDYVEVFFSRESKEWIVQLGIREDFRAASRITEEGFEASGGSNSEDFGANLSFTRKLK